MSKARRRLKAQRREAFLRQRNIHPQHPLRVCMNCKEQTRFGHFVPPGFGSPGMWSCKAAS